MALVTSSLLAFRTPLISAAVMFFASTLNIQFRKSDFPALAVIASGLGILTACWFATCLLGITLDFALIWEHIKSIALDVVGQPPATYWMPIS